VGHGQGDQWKALMEALALACRYHLWMPIKFGRTTLGGLPHHCALQGGSRHVAVSLGLSKQIELGHC
jgi:hypothetical protein